MPVDRYSRHHTITAWGERCTSIAWADDSRCSVDHVTILQRIERGFAPEDALTTPSLRLYKLTLWGETRRLADWGRDSSCKASAETVANRIAWGWDPEEALTTEPAVRLPVMLTWDGETKSIAAWARDKRCVPDVQTLRRRLRLSWPLADALSLPVRD